jgi:hypothetical protein
MAASNGDFFRKPGTFHAHGAFANVGAHSGAPTESWLEEAPMHGIIYIIGLIVVILFILSFLGLR